MEMNFVLLNSTVKQSGLEVECKGEVVRLESAPSAEDQTALAVKISDYRLLPLVQGRSIFDEPFGPPESEE